MASTTVPRRRPSPLLLLPLALLSMLGSTLVTAFVPMPTARSTAAPAPAPAPAAAAASRATPLSVRWAREGPEGQELPEGFPTDRPLTSVEKRRIERATKTDSARKLSKSQRILDDFIGKRMGQGTAFYGWVFVCHAYARLDVDRLAEPTQLKPIPIPPAHTPPPTASPSRT